MSCFPINEGWHDMGQFDEYKKLVNFLENKWNSHDWFSKEKVLVAGGLGLIGHAISKKLIELNAISIIIDLDTKENAKK